MALTSCPECGNQVSAAAAACPKCGAPNATGRIPSAAFSASPVAPPPYSPAVLRPLAVGDVVQLTDTKPKPFPRWPSKLKWEPGDEALFGITSRITEVQPDGAFRLEVDGGQRLFAPNWTCPPSLPAKTKNELASAGLVLGIASMFVYPFLYGIVPLAAVATSVMGLRKVRDCGGGGKVAAWVGLVLGAIYWLMWLRFFVQLAQA